MEKHIKRPAEIQAIVKNYIHRRKNWQNLKTVAVVSGLDGCGKTSLLLDHFKEEKHFYFSFAGLEESVAERLFVQRVSGLAGGEVTNWAKAFTVLPKVCKYIILDDLAPISSYKHFKKAFYENMCWDFQSRPLVFLIVNPSDDLGGLADKYELMNVNYFSIPEVIAMFPKLSKHDILALCAISGGIPKILREYDGQAGFEGDLRRLLRPDSAFANFMPYLMEKHFRKPEVYHHILCAISNGNHSISSIGKFTGYAYNKCDNYISSLISAGIVKADKEKSKHGTEKTVYVLTNPYFRLWYLYLYQNRAEIATGREKTLKNIITHIIEREIHAFHVEKAFAYVNEAIQGASLWQVFCIEDKISYAPQTVKKGSFSYTFDAIHRNGEKAVFVKVFADPLENCKQGEFEKIQRAVMLANKYYDSHVFVFAKRRFSDYAVKQAAGDESLSLIEVGRLKM